MGKAPGPEAGEEDRQSFVKASRMTEVVASSCFWEYMAMLLRLARVLDHAEHWMEACPCHYRQISGSSPLTSNTIFRTRYSCPMAGRRAPELASGALQGVLDEAFRSQQTELLLACSSLSASDRDTVLLDFGRGQAKLQNFLSIKLGFWQALPHRLLVLGHHNEAVARASLTEAKAIFDEHAASVHHHTLTKLYFQGLLSEHVQSFLSGEPRASSPALLREAAACAFVSCVERSIEARHALLKSKTSLMKKALPASFSIAIRSHEYHRRCMTDSTMLAEWEKHVHGLKINPRKGDAIPHVIMHLGMTNHPDIVRLRSQSQSGRVKMRDAANVVYHCDLLTQYDKRTEAGNGWQGQDNEQDKKSMMLRILMTEHFRIFATETLNFPETFCGDADINDAVAAVVAFEEPTTFVQIGHLDVAVVVHEAQPGRSCDDAIVGLLPQRTATGGLAVRLFDPPALDSIEGAELCVKQWNPGQTRAEYAPRFLPNFPDYIRRPAGELVHRMARMGAVDGSVRENPMHLAHDEDGVHEQLDALERLQEAGLAKSIFCNAAQSAWLLQFEALQHCQLQLNLQGPQLVFSAPQGSPALTWTRMELLSFLNRQGWCWNFLTDDPDARGAVVPLDLTFRVSDDKQIYILKGALSQRYLCCLAFVEAGLPLPGEPQSIEHFQKDAYYGNLLGIAPRDRRHPALPLKDTAAAVPMAAFQLPQASSMDVDFADMPPELGMEPEPDLPVPARRRPRGNRDVQVNFEDGPEDAGAEDEDQELNDQLLAFFDESDDDDAAGDDSWLH
ncbi:retm [Symbiodinium microadriaticum]|nr:retm [Symbiodinium microadriaticum]